MLFNAALTPCGMPYDMLSNCSPYHRLSNSLCIAYARVGNPPMRIGRYGSNRFNGALPVRLALTAEEVRAKLEKRLKKWQQSLHDGASWDGPMAGEQLLADFDAKCGAWANLIYESKVWRSDWACKEVVKCVRMKLAQAQAGWWSVDAAQKSPVLWTSFKDDKARDEHDRFIERTVQPMLVKAVVERLKTDKDFDLRSELDVLANAIRDA
jgi:hypothetical protein